MHGSRPRLKNGVDLQLQSAFSDGNWPVVIRLAEKRARALNDQYYEVLKAVAESQLDDATAKLAAVTALHKYVKDGTTIKDIDAIDLLEWAVLDFIDEDEFTETLGPLRVRAVKAAPKDKISASRALESCLLHWDLISAQQIAAMMDRSFSQERQFLFWNVVVTHLLSQSPQGTPEKRKLYGTLSLKQIERAAQMTDQAFEADKNGAIPARGIRSEEETLLLYEIVETHGSPEDYKKVISSPVFSPVSQFRRGRKEPVLRALAKDRRDGNWNSVFQICKDCLSEQEESGEPNLLASDWSIWKEFITAASHIKASDDSAPKAVQELLLKLIQFPKLKPIYKRNLQLARVASAFYLAPKTGDDVVDGKVSSVRLQELSRYIETQASNGACFEDIKSFIEMLDLSGLKHLTTEFLPNLTKGSEEGKVPNIVKGLSLKVQYFITTCSVAYSTLPGPSPKYKCNQCEADLDIASCPACFERLSERGLELYNDITQSDAAGYGAQPEILEEIIILLAFCSLKFMGSEQKAPYSPKASRYIFRALLLLEHQLAFNPKSSQMLLLTLQMHLLVGSAPRARLALDQLAIKRTIVDSLGPLFYDRLTTVSPHLLSPSDDIGWQVMDLLNSHYHTSLKLRMPRRLIDAFESESYGSILDIPTYINDLRRSCTRAISVVEETRSERLLGCPTWELFTDNRYFEVTDDLELKNVVDYGSFPSWESSSSAPIYTRLRIGPVPTNRRLHLSLLAEGFQDVMGYKPPTSYKVANASLPADKAFVLESLNQISNSISRFLPGPDSEFTAAEGVYFDLIGLLSTLVPLTGESSKWPAFQGTSDEIIEASKTALDTLRLQLPDQDDSLENAVATLGSMHAMALYRDSAVAISVTAQWILNFNDQEKERDRSGQSNLPKDTITAVKAMQAAATAALTDGKQRVAKLRQRVVGDFPARFKTWVWEDAGPIADIVEEDITADLVNQIRENVLSWLLVKWE